MNCKAGDLVRFVGANVHNRPNLFGWFGVVVKYTEDQYGQKCWEVNPALPGGSIFARNSMYHGKLVQDAHLRPIRDTPGLDESLQWAPVPGERVTA